MAVVAYTGFDDSDTESYCSVTDELEKIEQYIKEQYGGKICAAYGCSLGGTFVAHLAARHNISMKYGIIGSSDMDQAGNIKAALMANPDPYNKAFAAITGRDQYDMSFITKDSMINQFKSDLVTSLPTGIDNGETEIHVFYAKKMGEKYLGRYKKHFKNPIIHEQDMRHEEFLGVYPDDWCSLVKEICI